MAFVRSATTTSFFTPPSSSSKSQPEDEILRSSIAIVAATRIRTTLRASRRFSDFAQERVVEVVVPPDRRAWREFGGLDDREGYETDGDDDDDDDRSLDLLLRFLHNLFRKISKRARSAVRSVLPHPVPTKLVGFSVNGVLILAFLWILKALLEVVCTLVTMVFVSILLVRGIWSGITYIQESRYNSMDSKAWRGIQGAT